MALRETLTRLQKEQEDAARWETRKPELLGEWIRSIDVLFEEVKDFLKQYEADGVLTFFENEETIVEEALGAYKTKSLLITAGPIKIQLIPVGRIVVGGVGRVDMRRQGRGSATERVMFLRIQGPNLFGGSAWTIRYPEIGRLRTEMLEKGTKSKTEFWDFTKENFEIALDFLLES